MSALAAAVELPTAHDQALAAAVDKVYAEKGLSFDARPRYVSDVPADTDISNAIEGAKLVGLPLTPQGIVIAGVLEAHTGERDALTGAYLPLYSECTVQVPRRSTKTTVVQMVLLGRCASIPGYRVVSTAQDGTRASQFFMNMVRAMETRMRREKLTEADLGIKQIYRSQGREFIEWENGSRWWVVKPEASALRGEAADVMWFDEAGELNAAQAEDLIAGAFPLMDTRPLGQIIVSGTPGPARAGLLWVSLVAARADQAEYGIVDYSAPDMADVTDERVWWATHPGLACGLTTIVKLRKNLSKLGPAKFAQEYLCIWAADTTSTALDLDKWADTTCKPVPFAGQDFTLTFDCHIQGLSASLVATWIDEKGEVHGQVMDHRPGTEWLVQEVARANKAHPRVPVHYDAIGNNSAVAMSLQRVPGFRAAALRPVTMRDVAAGAALLASHLGMGTLHHAESAALDRAAENVAWRYSGESRLFQRKSATVDISALVAFSIGIGQSVARKAAPKKGLPRAVSV